jgi:SAM-dependent methyltransferase
MKTAKSSREERQRESSEIFSEDLCSRVFPSRLELVPQLNEVYELDLAFYESQILSDEEILRNGAYFAKVGDRYTRHFLMCRGEPVKLAEHSSSRLKSFFQTNQFKTGYATHGLFPYRGKFHPQMIKALLNVMGLKPGDTVLDPMMGSGTVLLEARLMGIQSVGLDASPFCRFMTQGKLDALTVPLAPVKAAVKDPRPVFDYFSGLVNGSKSRPTPEHDLFSMQKASSAVNKGRKLLPKGADNPDVYNFLTLAFLDSAGYSERSNRKSPFDQFAAILERYAFVAEKIQKVLEGVEKELAPAKALEGDARSLPLEDRSVDGILFSPPYSFAIDYLENDAFHLRFLGKELSKLRLYKKDMGKILSECARVLRTGKLCTVVVGTNNNQLGRILGIPPDQVEGIPDILTEMGESVGLSLVRKMDRQITGMANTMRTESILLLQRV